MRFFHYFLIGRRLYRIYRYLEASPNKTFTLAVQEDGIINSPRELSEVLRALLLRVPED